MLIAICFILLLLIGVPISFVLGITAIFAMIITGVDNLLSSMPSRMFTSTQNFGLLAIPLFILVGEIMNYGGITNRLIQFCNSLLGHIRGGLAYVNVVASAFLASILGSANAQAAIMSRVMVPEMEKKGYSRNFSAAVTAASSLMGPIIPPSMMFIMYGVTVGTSIGALFLAGIIPGILLGGSFIVIIIILSKRNNFPKSERESVKQIAFSFFKAIPALLIPFAIIVGISMGIFTATESAAIATFLSFIVGKFFYRELKMSDLKKILVNTAINTSIITFLVATASIFGWVLTFNQVPQKLTEVILLLASNEWVFLLLIMILFLFVGMILDGLAALIILVPILMPAVVHYGIDPLHFGVIVVLNLTIGLITPPVGTVLFLTSSITHVKFESLVKSLAPFILASIGVLLILTYIPEMTLYIPSIFGGE